MRIKGIYFTQANLREFNDSRISDVVGLCEFIRGRKGVELTLEQGGRLWDAMEALAAKGKPMHPLTLESIEGSIKAWELRAASEVHMRAGIAQCPLCVRFHKYEVSDDRKCHGCPIKIATGKSLCDGNEAYQDYHHAGDPETRQQAARAEVAFLKSLRPKETK